MKGNNEERNTYVRKQILHTLLTELEEKNLKDIVISTFVHDAGIGRASFYRNYDSLEDVLKQESDRLMKQWTAEFESNPASSILNVFPSLINFYRRNGRFYTILCKNDLSEIILHTILNKVQMSDDLSNHDAYTKSSFAYGLYGLIVEWIRRGMIETGEQLFSINQK